MTGSVDQQGRIQAIGGVNEKIEGFFDICAARGLTGTQGVLIPASNVRHLMLDERVVEAVAAGQFQIYAVSQLEEALALLTGHPAGSARNEKGGFPDRSVFARVDARLASFAEAQRAHRQRGS